MNLLGKLAQSLVKLTSVRRGVVLGPNVHIGPFSILSASRRLEIGENSYVGKFCSIQVNGRIGRGVLIANNVGIVGRLDHEYRVPGVPVRGGVWVGTDDILAATPENRISIGDDVWIGFGSVVLSGISIGEGAIVAAGSIVTKSVAPYAIVAGGPASVVGQRFGGDPTSIEFHRSMLRERYPPQEE